MRNLLFTCGVFSMFAIQAGVAQPLVFHIEKFPDNTIISLSLLDDLSSEDKNHDVSVVITLAKTNQGGGLIFADGGRHLAKVRCSSPASVMVNGLGYPVGLMGGGHARIDWKEDLWRTVCTTPMS